MSTQLVVGIIAGIAVIAAAVLGAPRVLRDPRASILKELEILERLPAESSSRASFLENIERQIVALDRYDDRRRNPTGIALGIIFFVLACACTWLVWVAGGWWWLTSPGLVALFVVGIVGFIQGVQKHQRSSTGGIL